MQLCNSKLLTVEPQLTVVDGKGSTGHHLSLSVQARVGESNPYRIVPIAFSEPMLGYSGQRFKGLLCIVTYDNI